MRRLAHPSVLLVVAAVVFGAVVLGREWRAASPQINDSILHEELAEYAALHWDEHWPVDFWFPSISAGFPMFAHYPHLSHLTAATLAHSLSSPADAGRIYDTLRTLLLVLMPLSIFASMRRMRFDRSTAAFAAVFYPLLTARGNFDIGWGGAIWRAAGLGPQVWGTFFLFPALAWGYAAVRLGGSIVAAGGLLALCFLSHFLFGYMAALSLAVLLLLPDRQIGWRTRAVRLSGVAAVAATATAYFAVPFVFHTDVLLRSRWEPSWKWDSHGWSWLIEQLASARLFDSAAPPVISLLVGLGLAVAVARALRGDQAARWLAASFTLWVVLLAGRAGLGGLADLLPLAAGLHMHRFVGGVQAFGLMLAGIGAGAGLVRLRRRLGRSRLALATSVAIVAACLAAPAWNQITFVNQSVVWAKQTKATVQRARDLREITALLRHSAPGRVHAGFHGTFGKNFKMGQLPVYALLQSEGFDMVGYLFMSMARPGEWQMRLDYRRRDHCDLFNLRYVVAPRSVFMPRFARQLAVRGALTLREIPTSGYFTTARVEPLPPDALAGSSAATAPWEEIYRVGDQWLQGPGPAANHFLALDNSTLPTLPSAPSGVVLDERIAANVYEARIAAAQATDVVLKVSHHPNWRAEVDGIGIPVREVLPSFMAVRLEAGQHRVRFTYEPPAWKKFLFWIAVCLITAALVAVVGEAVQSMRGGKSLGCRDTDPK